MNCEKSNYIACVINDKCPAIVTRACLCIQMAESTYVDLHKRKYGYVPEIVPFKINGVST